MSRFLMGLAGLALVQGEETGMTRRMLRGRSLAAKQLDEVADIPEEEAAGRRQLLNAGKLWQGSKEGLQFEFSGGHTMTDVEGTESQIPFSMTHIGMYERNSKHAENWKNDYTIEITDDDGNMMEITYDEGKKKKNKKDRNVESITAVYNAVKSTIESLNPKFVTYQAAYNKAVADIAAGNEAAGARSSAQLTYNQAAAANQTAYNAYTATAEVYDPVVARENWRTAWNNNNDWLWYVQTNHGSSAYAEELDLTKTQELAAAEEETHALLVAAEAAYYPVYETYLSSKEAAEAAKSALDAAIAAHTTARETYQEAFQARDHAKGELDTAVASAETALRGLDLKDAYRNQFTTIEPSITARYAVLGGVAYGGLSGSITLKTADSRPHVYL